MAEHTPEVLPAVQTSCANAGLTEGSRCSVCGEILVQQEVIPQLEHTPKTIHGIYPMCFRDGWTDGLECAVCGEILKECEVIPALSHITGGLPSEEPTCSSVGWTEGLACQICGYIIQPREMIAKLAHTPGAVHKEKWDEDPVLDANGEMIWDKDHHPYCFYKASECTECGEVCYMEYFEHEEGYSIPTNVGSADVCQSVTVFCGECNRVVRIYTTGHTPSTSVVPDSEGANWSVTACSVCGYEISRIRAEE